MRSGTTAAPASEHAIRMMIKMTDGDSFETNRSLIQELTFNKLEDELKRRDLEFTGSLFNQLTDAYKTIDFYNGTKATFHELLRTDERDYPEDSVREVLLNAIVHRDYAFSGSTFINLFSDRLEIISLGGLISGLSLEAAMLGASQPRNEKLASLFYRIN